MDTRLIARLGLSRLQLPVPPAKFAVVHSMAGILNEPVNGKIVWNELLDWLAGLELESEVVEALCIPVLAKHSDHVDIGALQRVIDRPSPLSDFYLSEISGRPLLINSWAKSHSNEVPPLFSPREIIQKLKTKRLMPEILVNRLEKLEKQSERPFLKQWAYEFQRIIDRLGELSEGHLEHFVHGDRQRSFGQFVTRKNLAARSAYLRTLSLAFDCWEMPEDLAFQEAAYATPSDLTFLKMLPGVPPSWNDTICNSTPCSTDEWQSLLSNIVNNLTEDDNAFELLHLNIPLTSTVHYQAEVELVSCLYMKKEPDPEEVFRVHQYLPGKAELPRTKDWKIMNPQQDPDVPFPCSDGGLIFPALMPSVNRYVGYFQMELIQRIPYLPANYAGSTDFIAQPRQGGMDLIYGNKFVGEISLWNWRWSPTFDKALGPHCGTSLTLSKECCSEILNVPDATFSRYWRATVLKREKEHGEWEEEKMLGRLL
jgi:hypothetical protein